MSVELLTSTHTSVVEQLHVPTAADASTRTPANMSATPAARLTTKTLLFDLDGTLVNSTAAVETFWTNFAHDHNLSPSAILSTSHGRRTVDVLNEHLGSDHPYDERRIVEFESEIPRTLGHKALPVPGAHELLQSLPNKKCWAIVTSGSRGLAGGWLKAFGWTEPEVFVTSESVARGKPDPLGYKLAFSKLTGSSSSSNSTAATTITSISLPADASSTTKTPSIVFEDAPAGIRAGKASGAQAVVGLATTYDAETVKRAGADYVIPDMTHVRVLGYDEMTGMLEIGIYEPIYTPDL